jgi:hypothetical protein
VAGVAAAVVTKDVRIVFGTGEVVGHLALSAVSILEVNHYIRTQHISSITRKLPFKKDVE